MPRTRLPQPPRLRCIAFAAALTVGADAVSAQQVLQTATDVPEVVVSGVLFANYQYRLRPPGGANRFDLDRAYVNVVGPIGNRVSFRVTSDVYRSERDTLDRSLQIRLKYGYLQYDYSRSQSWPAWVRGGMLQTVFIDHDESFWPRWLGNVPTDRHGYFSSADLGISTRLGLPGRRGEVYATITNGPGFAFSETDRFKDYAARLTITPFRRADAHPLRSLALTAWGYKGARASRFVAGGTDQVGPIGGSLRRDRWGVFAAVGEPKLTMAVQYAGRTDEGETGANTAADPRVVIDSSGSILAAYGVARPFSGRAQRLFLVGRWDHVEVNRAVGRSHDFVVGGLGWTLNAYVAGAVSYQATYPSEGSTAAPSRTVFLQTQLRF